MARIMNDAVCREAAKKFRTRLEFNRGDNVAWRYASKTGLINQLFPNKVVKQSAVTFEKCQTAVLSLKEQGKTAPIDFWNFNRTMFEFARDHGWLVTWYPSYKLRRSLSKEDVYAIAKQCNTRSEFAKLDGAAYKKACDEHWISEIFPETVHHAEWTKESCKEVAALCKTRKEFKKKFQGAYKVACQNDWIDELFPRIHNIVTESRCREVAMQCKTKSEFREKGGHLYNFALDNNLVDVFAVDYNWQPTSEVESNAQRKYSDDYIIQVAKKYTKLSVFRKKDKRIYDIAYERNMIPSFTWLERNEEVIENGFHDCVYVYEFIGLRTAYIGRTINKQHRDNAHRNNIKDCVRMFADSVGVNVPEVKYIISGISPKMGCKVEAETIANYLNDGWILLNKQKSSGLGTLTTVSKKAYINFAKQFEYWNDLYKASVSKFNMIKKYGWDKECSWLKDKKAKNGTWSKATFEKIADEASKYTSRTEFMNGASAAYERARSQGWVSKLFPISKQWGKPKSIAACDPNTGEIIEVWQSTKLAAKALNTRPSIITQVLKGKRKTHRGYKFKSLAQLDFTHNCAK